MPIHWRCDGNWESRKLGNWEVGRLAVLVRFFDTYSAQSFEDLIRKLKLSEFVQAQTAQIAARQIVQLPPAQLGSMLLPCGGGAEGGGF